MTRAGRAERLARPRPTHCTEITIFVFLLALTALVVF